MTLSYSYVPEDAKRLLNGFTRGQRLTFEIASIVQYYYRWRIFSTKIGILYKYSMLCTYLYFVSDINRFYGRFSLFNILRLRVMRLILNIIFGGVIIVLAY